MVHKAVLSVEDFIKIKEYEQAMENKSKNHPLRETVRLAWLDLIKLFSYNFFQDHRPLKSTGLFSLPQ